MTRPFYTFFTAFIHFTFAYCFFCGVLVVSKNLFGLMQVNNFFLELNKELLIYCIME